MYNSLYCKMFIDTDIIYEELFALVLKFVGGKKQAVTYISTQWCDISIQKNNEYNAEYYLLEPKDFLYWRYYLDIEPNEIEESAYIKNVSDLLEYIRGHCNDAIVACDFEDELYTKHYQSREKQCINWL